LIVDLVPSLQNKLEIIMTVHSTTISVTAPLVFPKTGKYCYTTLLLDFAQWGVDLPSIRKRINELKAGEEFATLFRDIIVARGELATWHKHPNAGEILLGQYRTLNQAWLHMLSHAPDRTQLALEYLADALKAFADQTKMH
jgi:hypothetical protein